MTSRGIVLVGFMGCGKTTVGAELARRLDCDFVDLDTFITENMGRTPAEIIQQDGEPEFRVIETHSLKKVLEISGPNVIALGGGAWTISVNRTLVGQQSRLSIWLDTPFEFCWQRIAPSGDVVRPLAPDRKTAKELYESRRDSYALASVRVEVREGDSVHAIVDKILSLI
jgi:shikimate kinase